MSDAKPSAKWKHEPRRPSGATRKWLIAIGVVVVAAGAIFATCKITRYQLRNAPGQPQGELVVAGTLIVLDYVEIGGTDAKDRPQPSTAKGQRLTSIDIATGAQLAVDVGDYQQCWPGGTRVACIDIYDQLDLLDPATLAVTHRAADLIAAAKLAKPTRRIEVEGQTFVVVLEDGRGAQIDPAPATPTVTAVDSVTSRFVSPARSGCDGPLRVRDGDHTLQLESAGTRARLTSTPPPPAESATPSAPALSFLEPRFLDGGPLVLHRAALGDKVEHVISRVAGISKESWRVPLEGECRKTFVRDPLLVVTTSNPARRAIGIELATGRVAWTFGR